MHAIGYVTCDTHCTCWADLTKSRTRNLEINVSRVHRLCLQMCVLRLLRTKLWKKLFYSKVSRISDLVLRTNHFWKTWLKVFMVCDPRLLHFVFNWMKSIKRRVWVDRLCAAMPVADAASQARSIACSAISVGNVSCVGLASHMCI